MAFVYHDSRAGTLVHEASHFENIGRTKDHVREYERCHEVAQTHPAVAVNNANNYKWYSENKDKRT